MGHTIVESQILVTETCCVCGVLFAMPEDLHNKCRRDPSKDFFCPNGHSLVFKKSIDAQEIERLKREKDELERSRYSLHNELQAKKDEVDKLQKSIKRRNKRIAAGVCPCCNRTVSQLAEHMKTMHPDIVNAPKVAAIHKKISNRGV